jgi:hypothetical protein
MATRELTLYDSILSSNLPYQEKSQLRRWFEKATSDLPVSVRPSSQQIHGTLSAFRQGTESLATGILLGVANVELPNGLDYHGVPLDALLGTAGLIGSALAAGSDMAPDARNIGSVGLGVFGMRMTTKLLAEKRLSSGKSLPRHLNYNAKIYGDSEPSLADDPIVKAAENL